jgi:Cd2+/Zn2+-exporting ATPase
MAGARRACNRHELFAGFFDGRRHFPRSGWPRAICSDGLFCATTSARKPRRSLTNCAGEGLRSVVLTGDRLATAEFLRAELKLDDVRAELKPEQKVEAIRELSGQGKRVAMIGDGVNDAPSLAAAYIGVAMGARGSDAALEQADVVLMHDKLENFLAAFRLSQRARRVIRQNLVISLGTVVVLVSFALLGKIPLTIGVVGHEGSTVVVVMNSLRLLFGKASARLEP